MLTTVLGFIVGTTALVLGIYWLARLAGAKHLRNDTEQVCRSIVLSAGTMHALILALVFVQVIDRYQELRSAVVQEASAIADIDHDIRRYVTEYEDAVRTPLAKYVYLVASEEWSRLGSVDRLTAEGWDLFEEIYLGILDLNPTTPRQQSLRDHMLNKVHDIADMRVKRENMSNPAISGLFWFAAVAGVALVGGPYFYFAPTPLNLTVLSVYGVFTGIVLFITFALSDPFRPPGELAPVAFERLLAGEIGERAPHSPEQ